jgi:predicted GTPase
MNRLTGLQFQRQLSFGSMLQPHHTSVVKEEAELLSQLYNTVLALDPECEDLNIIKDTLSGIDDLFMVVVVGEFNSGKSTLINSLLGGNFLKTGFLPTTSKVCVLRSSSNVESRTWKVTSNVLLKDFEEIDLPVEWLKHIAIVDTPGTNAVIAQHEKITHQVVPRADLILFVTSAERPITETEADFLRKIAKWGKKGMKDCLTICIELTITTLQF